MSVRGSRSTLALTAVLFTTLAPLGCTGGVTVGPSGTGDDPVVVLAAADGQGSATLTPSGDVTVATVGTWSVTFEAGPGGIGGGGAVRFTIPGLWTPPSLGPWAMGHVTVASNAGDVMLDVQVENNVPDPAETHVDAMADRVTVELAAGVLDQGDTVTLTYGDTSGGGEGAQAPFAALKGMPFLVETDAQGDGSFEALTSSPAVDVVPGPPVALRVVATRTLITAGEEVELDVHVEDEFGNGTTGFAGNLTVAATPRSTAVASFAPTLALQAADDSVVSAAEVTEPGVLWFDVSDPSGTLAGDTSNPVMVREAPVLGPPDTYDPPANHYDFWGDLHAHSNISNNAPLPPDETYEFMIDDANLKFGAITDYDSTTNDAQWSVLKEAANDYLCVWPFNPANCFDGKHFVTFLATERNPDYGDGGHMNLYFVQDDEGSIVYQTSGDESIPLYRHTDPSDDYDEPCELWEAYQAQTGAGGIEGFDFFSIPHHPAATDDVPPRHDLDSCPQQCTQQEGWEIYQPLVEGFSKHGNSMWSYMSFGEFQAFPEDDPISCREDSSDRRVVQDALDPNEYSDCEHRLGIIGSGDSHDGRPGRPYLGPKLFEVCPGDDPPRKPGGSWGNKWYRSPRKGLLCVYAQGASAGAAFQRETIFDALRARSTYATTGARIGLWFEIEADDSDPILYMGQEHEDDSDTYEAHIQAAAHGDPIRYWRLLRYDPSETEWTVCKEAGPLTSTYSINEAVDLDAQNPSCIESGTNIYYVEIEQDLAIAYKFRVHGLNKWIDFKVEGDDTQYSAAIDHRGGGEWYSPAEVAAEIAEAMNDAYTPGTDPFSASYSSGTHKFTITNDDDDEFELLWYSGSHGFWFVSQASKGSKDNAALLLGFDNDDPNADTGFDTSHTTPNPIYSDGWSEREMAWSSPIWIDY